MISAREKEIIAYHEAGHALVGAHAAQRRPAVQDHHRVARHGGRLTRASCRRRTATCRRARSSRTRWPATLGGHVAEELVFGEMTTGPENDIEQATKIARQMVTQYGMSERLGPRTFGRKEELVFLGREISEQRNYSEKVAEEIDEEVRRIIDHAYQVAKKTSVGKSRQAGPVGATADRGGDAGGRRAGTGVQRAAR